MPLVLLWAYEWNRPIMPRWHYFPASFTITTFLSFSVKFLKSVDVHMWYSCPIQGLTSHSQSFSALWPVVSLHINWYPLWLLAQELHMIKSLNERHSWDFTSNWVTTGSWWSLKEGQWVSFCGRFRGRLYMIQWMMPNCHVHKISISWTQWVIKKKEKRGWGVRGKDDLKLGDGCSSWGMVQQKQGLRDNISMHGINASRIN